MSNATQRLTGTGEKPAHLPPRWFIRTFWVVQRAVYSITRGRFGLRRATADQWGVMRLRTIGRRTGRPYSSVSPVVSP